MSLCPRLRTHSSAYWAFRWGLTFAPWMAKREVLAAGRLRSNLMIGFLKLGSKCWCVFHVQFALLLSLHYSHNCKVPTRVRSRSCTLPCQGAVPALNCFFTSLQDAAGRVRHLNEVPSFKCPMSEHCLYGAFKCACIYVYRLAVPF